MFHELLRNGLNQDMGKQKPFSKDDYPLWKECELFFKILGKRELSEGLIDEIMEIINKKK